MLKPLDVPEWKWESISMDFIVGLSRLHKGNDSIWVIVDRLTKIAHFVPVKTKTNVGKLTDLYSIFSDCMELPLVLYLIVVLSLCLDFGKPYTSPLEPNLTSVPLIIHRQMDRLNE